MINQSIDQSSNYSNNNSNTESINQSIDGTKAKYYLPRTDTLHFLCCCCDVLRRRKSGYDAFLQSYWKGWNIQRESFAPWTLWVEWNDKLKFLWAITTLLSSYILGLFSAFSSDFKEYYCTIFFYAQSKSQFQREISAISSSDANDAVPMEGSFCNPTWIDLSIDWLSAINLNSFINVSSKETRSAYSVKFRKSVGNDNTCIKLDATFSFESSQKKGNISLIWWNAKKMYFTTHFDVSCQVRKNKNEK